MQIEPNAATAGRPNEPTRPQQPMAPSEAFRAIAQAMRESGLVPPPEGSMVPGKVIRFPTGKRSSDTAGWLIIFHDYQGAAYGDWRTDQYDVWHAHNPSQMTAAERSIFKRLQREAISARDREMAAIYEKGASEAALLGMSGAIS